MGELRRTGGGEEKFLKEPWGEPRESPEIVTKKDLLRAFHRGTVHVQDRGDFRVKEG